MHSRSVLLSWGCLTACCLALGCDKPAPVPAPQTAQSKPAPPAPVRIELPTDNRALYESGGEPRFFTPTGPDFPWTSGAFGCVRNSGTRFHEGVDIRCLVRDRQGEPVDAVRAAAPGRIAFINRSASASDYGQYLVLLHEVDGLTVYTLYAHWREIASELRPDAPVQAGQTLGTLGRTAKSPIPAERAHLHFEVGLLGSPHFDLLLHRWYQDPGPNPFGNWNGQNLLGFDPAALLIAQQQAGPAFNMRAYLAQQPSLCTVRIHKSSLPVVTRYPAMVQGAPGTSAFEVDLNPQGVPLRIRALPSSSGQFKRGAYELVTVDEALEARHRCNKLVFKKGRQWVLTERGQRAVDLLAFAPGS